MTEFKQIIGRGTRIREADGKVFFTVMDFRKVTNLFADPDFDGNPVQIYQPDKNDPVTPPDNFDGDPETDSQENDPSFEGRSTKLDVSIDDQVEEVKKFYVNNIPVSVASERVQYYGKDGKLITESLKKYSKDNILKEFNSLDGFIRKWNESEKKKSFFKRWQNTVYLLRHCVKRLEKI